MLETVAARLGPGHGSTRLEAVFHEGGLRFCWAHEQFAAAELEHRDLQAPT